MELFKSITCEKLRRAPKAAAAARFFDESVRNSYARRATTPQTASWRQGEFRAEARKRSRRCGNFDAQPSRIKTRAFLFGGRAALAVRNKEGSRRCVTLVRTPLASVSGAQQIYVSGAQQNTPYASKPLYGAMRIRLTVEVRERFADRTTF